jgi:cellulose synthase/poly-beta-1,6-N-acetylglucosamine synthase-like glycosyltransferase
MFNLLRCIRLAFSLIQSIGYESLRSDVLPSISNDALEDVTIISCTIGTEVRYRDTLLRLLESRPKEIIIVTVESGKTEISKVLRSIGSNEIRLLSIENADFRKQMALGIRNTRTKVVVFADDRTFWGPRTLLGLLSGLENPAVGGVITMQRVIPTRGVSGNMTMWESFGALNLVRRNILHAFLAFFNHGQVLNLSGRTVAYRTAILQDEEFYMAYLNDHWRGKYALRTGDDNFLTTWALHHGWKTAFINDSSATITCHVCPDSVYLKQVLRWSRDTARYYLRDLAWAIKRQEKQHVVRCLLNWACNYFSDLELLIELFSLLVISVVSVFNYTAKNSNPW